ncbi:MAG: Mor transcription activator family protein [Anaeroplasma sp.]
MNFKEDIKALSLWSDGNKGVKRCENFIEVLNCIGLENGLKVINLFGGSNIYIPIYDTIVRNYRNNLIYQDYINGMKYNHLAMKYNLTERCIRAIIMAKMSKK